MKAEFRYVNDLLLHDYEDRSFSTFISKVNINKLHQFVDYLKVNKGDKKLLRFNFTEDIDDLIVNINEIIEFYNGAKAFSEGIDAFSKQVSKLYELPKTKELNYLIAIIDRYQGRYFYDFMKKFNSKYLSTIVDWFENNKIELNQTTFKGVYPKGLVDYYIVNLRKMLANYKSVISLMAAADAAMYQVDLLAERTDNKLKNIITK